MEIDKEIELLDYDIFTLYRNDILGCEWPFFIVKVPSQLFKGSVEGIYF